MMKRWHWFALSLLAAPLAVTLTMVPRFTGSTQRAEAQQPPSLVLDMDVTNGAGPCHPIDATRNSSVGGPSYQIAVCLVGSGPSPNGEPAAFQFDLVYDDSLNQCVPVNWSGPSLDGNPDANAGVTTFSNPALGPGYDCSSVGLVPPVCDKDPITGPGHGRASLGCFTVGDPTLPVGPGIASPIAMVTFKAVADGLDTLSLDNVIVVNTNGDAILLCPGGPGACVGGTDKKLAGVGGIVNLPPPAVAADSDAPSDGSAWPAGAYAALAGAGAAAVIVLGAGGWYARRRRLR